MSVKVYKKLESSSGGNIPYRLTILISKGGSSYDFF